MDRHVHRARAHNNPYLEGLGLAIVTTAPSYHDFYVTTSSRREIGVIVERSAGVLVEVYPIGEPGRVAFLVSNYGPEPLARDEVVRTLRAAADQMESEPEADRMGGFGIFCERSTADSDS